MSLSAEISVGESFSVSIISGIENVLDKRGGAIHVFPSTFFCLTVTKNFIGEPFSVSVFPGIKNFYASNGYVTVFCRNILCLGVPKNLIGEPYCAVFQKISVSQNVYG